MEDLIPGLPQDIARECLIRVPFDRFRTVRSVCRFWKLEVDSPDFHRTRASASLTRTAIVLVQAEPAIATTGPAHKYATSASTPTYRLVLYQPDSDTWTSLPPVPGLHHGIPLFCQVAAVGRVVILIGGWNPETWAASDGVFVYDFVKSTWRRGAPMPGPRRSFFACAASVDADVVYVAGGHDEEKNALRSAIAYDVAGDLWAPLPDMARGRDECRGVFLRGKFHVIGGYGTDAQGRFGKSAECFDPATWMWGPVEEDRIGSPTSPRTCVAGSDERMYMCAGGRVLLTEGMAWRVVAEVPEDSRVGPTLLACKGLLMVIGSGSHGGALAGYTLDLRPDKSATWLKVDVPLEYSGLVQSGCCLAL